MAAGAIPAVLGQERRDPMSAVRRHPIITFFILTYALTFLGGWVLYAVGVWPIPFFTGGPLLAALIVIPLTQGLSGLRELGSRMIRWRVGWIWYAVAIGLPLTVLLVTVGLNVALGAGAPSLAQVGPLSTIIAVFAVRLINPLDGGAGRGAGLARLRPARPAGIRPLAASRRPDPRAPHSHLASTPRPLRRHEAARLLGTDRVYVRGHMGLQPHWRQRVDDPRDARRRRDHPPKPALVRRRERGHGAGDLSCGVVRRCDRLGHLGLEVLARSCACDGATGVWGLEPSAITRVSPRPNFREPGLDELPRTPYTRRSQNTSSRHLGE